METLRNTDTPRSTTSHALQLLMCHAGLQSFYDQSTGLELLKVSVLPYTRARALHTQIVPVLLGAADYT